MPAQLIGIGQQLVLRDHHCQLQAIGTAIVHLEPRNDPLALAVVQALLSICPLIDQQSKGRIQLRDFGQFGGVHGVQ